VTEEMVMSLGSEAIKTTIYSQDGGSIACSTGDGSMDVGGFAAVRDCCSRKCG